MRFESVKAHDFGPFHERTLDLAPGMNVVYGPNEAGKSSWHAALYAGLCGLRRGKGQPLKDDREFAERHRPWDGSGAWEAGAVVELADGRRVELRHELAGKVDCSAQDADLAGRDYTSDVLFDGSPDGSRWLGLNRKSFLSTACIRQADIFRVLGDADLLQQDLQRAAATAGTDATAAEALRRLGEYRAEHVGSRRAPTKPLLKSERKTAEANAALEMARGRHHEYMGRRAHLERLERKARDARLRADAVGAALAEAESAAFEDRLRRVRNLDALFPDGAPHPSPAGDALAARVAVALTSWKNRPGMAELTGRTAEELDRMIAECDAELVAGRAIVAKREAEEAECRLNHVRELDALFPDGPPRAPTVDEDLAAQVMSVLKTWETLPAVNEPDGPSVEDFERELAAFDAKVRAAPPVVSRRRLWLLALSVLAITGGAATALALHDFAVVGAIIAVAGLGGALAWLALSRSNRQSVDIRTDAVLSVHRDNIVRGLDARRREQRAYEKDLHRQTEALGHLCETAAACGSNVAEPELQAQYLRDWQDRRKLEMRQRDKLSSRWDELQQLQGSQPLDAIADETARLREKADALVAAADDALLEGFRERSVTREHLSAMERQANAKRIEWEGDRRERLTAERQHGEKKQLVDKARGALRGAAESAGVTSDDEDGLVAALEKWQEDREKSIARAEQQGKYWDELQQLRGDRSLDEMECEAARLQNNAAACAADVGKAALADARRQQPGEETLTALQAKADAAYGGFRDECVRLEGFANTLPSVADAEETLDDALREQERVALLERALDSTIRFLEQAQERIQRNIAPILSSTVLEWLPRVTDGRYDDCRIDPESLLVEVCGRNGWHRAQLLSHGTAEQIYLLLRLALARHLTKEGEVCPLILDDVVSASDALRKRVVLETLLAISESTQVVLFTHEDDVRDWARERLAEPLDRLTEIPVDADSARAAR